MSPTVGTKIKVSELARRITGFSFPGFGLQWSPAEDERKTVRTFLTFLEDRRALYRPEHLEVAGEVEHPSWQYASNAPKPYRHCRNNRRQFLPFE